MIKQLAKFRVYLDKLELCPKNLSSTISFGEFKTYHYDRQLEYINYYDNGKLQ